MCRVDFAGPFATKHGRGCICTKRYLCLFDCLSVRGVHLQVTESLDVHDFLTCFIRMIARRGRSNVAWTDNRTKFVAADKELQEAVRAIDFDNLQSGAARMQIVWRFNAPPPILMRCMKSS